MEAACDKNLSASIMKLTCAGVRIENEKKLSEYGVLTQTKVLMTIVQTKCELDQMEGLIISYEEDEIGD